MDDLRLAVLSAHCADPCELQVRLTNPSGQTARFLPDQRRLAAVRADGWDVPLALSAPTPAEPDTEALLIAPGAHLDLTLAEAGTLDGVRPGRGQVPVRLLRVDDRLVRLPTPTP